MLLHKYVSAATAMKIIHSKKLYCAPMSSFNDPFEGQVFELHDSISKEVFADEVCRQFREMHANGEEVPLELDQYFNPIKGLVAFFQNGGLQEMDHKSFETILRDFILSRELLTEPSLFTLRVHQGLVEYLHVFCLSSNPNSLLIWSHYADHHKGILLTFETDIGDSFLSRAQPVSYVSEFPGTSSLSAIVASHLGRKIDATTLCATTSHTKSREWAYEEEWRVVLRHDELDDLNLVSFPPEALRRVVFGCRMAMEDRAIFHDQLSRALPHVECFYSIRDSVGFRLHLLPQPSET